MKKFQSGLFALVVAATFSLYSCGPNDDKGGMDTKNSAGEGAIDSSRLPDMDTSSASVSVPDFINSSIQANLGEIQISELGKQRGTYPAIKELANNLVIHHNQMLSELTRMATARKIEIATQPSENAADQFHTLGNAPSSTFDNVWKSTMLQMHQTTLQQYEIAKGQLNDQEVKQWLSKTLPLIEEHRNLLENLSAKA